MEYTLEQLLKDISDMKKEFPGCYVRIGHGECNPEGDDRLLIEFIYQLGVDDNGDQQDGIHGHSQRMSLTVMFNELYFIKRCIPSVIESFKDLELKFKDEQEK